MRALIPAGAILLAAGGALAQAPAPATCERDRIQAEAAINQVRYRLTQSASLGDADRCALWRDTAATYRRSAAVFNRCLAGATRTDRVGFAEQSAREFEDLAKQRCRR
jgi:hypothetical protein